MLRDVLLRTVALRVLLQCKCVWCILDAFQRFPDLFRSLAGSTNAVASTRRRGFVALSNIRFKGLANALCCDAICSDAMGRREIAPARRGKTMTKTEAAAADTDDRLFIGKGEQSAWLTLALANRRFRRRYQGRPVRHLRTGRSQGFYPQAGAGHGTGIPA